MSRRPAPIGTIAIHRLSGRRARQIKVLNARGEPYWRLYAQHVYEVHHGPIPEGRCVIHADGDTLNDDPANLVLGTPGDTLFLALENAKVERRRKQAVRKAHGQRNTEVAKLRRAFSWLRSQWYLHIEPRGFVTTIPFARHHALLAHYGLPTDPNAVRQMRRLGIRGIKGHKIPAEGVARTEDEHIHPELRRMLQPRKAPWES